MASFTGVAGTESSLPSTPGELPHRLASHTRIPKTAKTEALLNKEWDTVEELKQNMRELSKEAASLEAAEHAGPAALHFIAQDKENSAAPEVTFESKVERQVVSRRAESAFLGTFKNDYYKARSEVQREKRAKEGREVAGRATVRAAQDKIEKEGKLEGKAKERARKEEEFKARIAARQVIENEKKAAELKEREYASTQRAREKEMVEEKRLAAIRERREKVLERREQKARVDTARTVVKQAEKEEAKMEWDKEIAFRAANKKGTKVKSQVWGNLKKLNDETSLLDLPFG